MPLLRATFISQDSNGGWLQSLLPSSHWHSHHVGHAHSLTHVFFKTLFMAFKVGSKHYNICNEFQPILGIVLNYNQLYGWNIKRSTQLHNLRA